MITRHEAAIKQIQASTGAKVRGFKQTLEKVFAEPGELDWVTVIPDAFTVTPTHVIVWEVEDTHRVDLDKLDLYARLWWYLDERSCLLELRIQDIRGGTEIVDLGSVYFRA